MEDKIKVVTIKVTCKQTMNFIEQFSNKTGDNTPLYTINGVNFHVLYEEEKMYSREEVIILCKEAFSCGVRLWEEWEEEDHLMWEKFVNENFNVHKLAINNK